MKLILIAALLMLTSLSARADVNQHAIDIMTDKIVINTDSLSLPSSTTAYEVLSLLPDLVERTKDFVLENYDIQINGKSVGSARDAVLQQIRISDLRCIEVSENSLSSISSMGSGGGISLELRTAKKGLNGAVNAEVTSEANYSGGFRIDNANDKWVFHGIATAENYVPSNFCNTSQIYTDGVNISNSSAVTKMRDFSQIATAFIEYRPTAVDLFKLNVSEVYTNSRSFLNNYILNNNTDVMAIDTYKRTRDVNTFLGFNYEHLWPSLSKICFEIDYRFVPEKYDGNGHYYLENNYSESSSYEHNAHNVSCELKLEQPLMAPASTKSVKMELGAQYNAVIAHNNSEGSYPETLISEADENTYFLRPYVKFDAQVNKWQFMGNVDLQHFNYETTITGRKGMTHHYCNDVTGQTVAMYKFNSRSLLRFRYIYGIKRPSSEDLYPYAFYDPVNNSTTIGNIDLKPQRHNVLDLDYCLNLSTSRYHLELKTSVEYAHAYDIISVDTAAINPYIKKINVGKTDAVIGDLGVYFRMDRFSVWLSSNIYHCYMDKDERAETDHCTYYNILFRPIINIGRGWLIACSAIYNSKVVYQEFVEGAVFYGGLRICKTWKHFNAYIYGNQNFLGKEKSELYFNDNMKRSIQYVDQDYMHSSFGAGIRYSF